MSFFSSNSISFSRAIGVWACCWLLACCAARDAAAQPQLADFVTLTTISDGDPGTDDTGWANVEINATAFKNQSLVTVGDYQFTSYYAADETLILGRRNLASAPGTWTLLRTGFTSFNINDSHNVSTIGIDGDGFLHVAWGVHNNDLLYTRSTAPVLNDDPFAVPGVIENVIPEQDDSITYPEFWNIPGSGDLLLSYRTGGSGNGEYQLSRWDDQSDAWSAVHVRVGSPTSQNGDQPWIDNDFSFFDDPPNVNAYHNGLVYDSTGRLHVTWTWRTGGDSPTPFGDYQSNHNIMYAYSDNHGVDWFSADGTQLQRTDGNNETKHDIDEDNATPAILLPEGSSLINQASSAVGPDDTLYLSTWYAPEAASGNHLRQYMLVEYDGNNWSTHQITNRDPESSGIGTNRVPESQLGTVRMSRPIVLTDEEDRVLVAYSDYQRGQGVTVAYSESDTRDDWQFVDLTTNEDLNLWEPKYDVNRWQNDGVLSMLYQRAGGLSPKPVSILEWDARAFFFDATVPPLEMIVNRTTGEVTIANPADTAQDISKYSVGSAGGQLSPGGWQSFQDQALPGWVETQASPMALVEETDTSPVPIPSADSVEIGAAYAGEPVAFGVDAPGDVTFQYDVGSVVRTGNVTYIGESRNNLMLQVDPDTGHARLENTSPFTVSIDGYTIWSLTDSLDPANWMSLEQQAAENATWVEVNDGTERITELQPTAETVLAPGDSFYLGRLFDTVDGQTDLMFEFLLDDDEVASTGVVHYTSLGLPGDYNDDGVVNAADYTVWRDLLGTAAVLPNDMTPGSVDPIDYAIWVFNFGSSLNPPGAVSLQPVPEPSTLALMAGMTAVCLLLGCGRPNGRRCAGSGSV